MCQSRELRSIFSSFPVLLLEERLEVASMTLEKNSWHNKSHARNKLCSDNAYRSTRTHRRKLCFCCPYKNPLIGIMMYFFRSSIIYRIIIYQKTLSVYALLKLPSTLSREQKLLPFALPSSRSRHSTYQSHFYIRLYLLPLESKKVIKNQSLFH